MKCQGGFKRCFQSVRFSGKIWVPLLGAVLVLFSTAAAQKKTKSQSSDPKTKKGMEQRKAPPPSWLVEKKLFFQKTSLGTITSIQLNRTNRDSQPALVVAGNHGAVFVTDSGGVVSSVRFDQQGENVVPIDLDADGHPEFINRGGKAGQVGLFDHEGRIAWKYGLGSDPASNDMACGDLDGDGLMECAVGMKGNGGIRLLDRNGKELWNKPETNVWHVEILDVDGDGKNEIVYTNAAGLLRIRNADGEIVRELPGNNFITLFSLCRRQNPDSGWFILNNNNRTGIQVIDFEGNVVTPIPTNAKGYEAIGTPVQLEAGKAPYFAMLVCNCTPHRDSRLFIYDLDGNIIYEEKLFPSQAALLTVPDETSGLESLLVGEGEGKVWQYRLAPATPRN